MDSSRAPRVLRQVQGVDARALPIGPEEAFVLSCVDGLVSEAEVVSATGLDAQRVHAALQTLEQLGAVRFEAPPPRTSLHPPPRPSSSNWRLQPAIETEPDRAFLNHPAAALYDPGELDEQVDLELQRKRQILDLYYRLDTLNHYELLGVDPNADRAQVKAAYYRVVSVFHPDRHFGKNLGSFKSKLEKVFARLTAAYDVLTRAPSRTEYDAYLSTQKRNRDLERMLRDDASQEVELEHARRLIEEQARLSERIETAPTPSLQPSSRPPLDPEVRKRALARKLGRTGPPPPTPPQVSQEEIRERVARDLRRRYEQRILQARAEQVQRYVDDADAAIMKNNAIAAANSLRIAVLLAPDDRRLAERLAEVQQIASVELADSYVEQAQYEERSGQFAEAALSYQKALAGRSTAKLNERLAYCLLEAGGDLRKAGEHAKTAVSLAPNDAALRTTLGRVYLAAGMKQSAVSELERATALAPSDASIKEWLKRARRGDV